MRSAWRYGCWGYLCLHGGLGRGGHDDVVGCYTWDARQRRATDNYDSHDEIASVRPCDRLQQLRRRWSPTTTTTTTKSYWSSWVRRRTDVAVAVAAAAANLLIFCRVCVAATCNLVARPALINLPARSLARHPPAGRRCTVVTAPGQRPSPSPARPAARAIGVPLLSVVRCSAVLAGMLLLLLLLLVRCRARSLARSTINTAAVPVPRFIPMFRYVISGLDGSEVAGLSVGSGRGSVNTQSSLFTPVCSIICSGCKTGKVASVDGGGVSNSKCTSSVTIQTDTGIEHHTRSSLSCTVVLNI